jgi:disulfide oxidoreductase YuzD|tara:strand:- start:7483 stop:7734 length:252 start_codon:yes stop_codon:yes gene_type:complete
MKSETAEKSTKLKEMLVDYVGNTLNPKNENVTVEMIIKVVAEEFPEFLLVVAEENYLRGYEQALTDVYKNEETKDGLNQIHTV